MKKKKFGLIGIVTVGIFGIIIVALALSGFFSEEQRLRRQKNREYASYFKEGQYLTDQGTYLVTAEEDGQEVLRFTYTAAPEGKISIVSNEKETLSHYYTSDGDLYVRMESEGAVSGFRVPDGLISFDALVCTEDYLFAPEDIQAFDFQEETDDNDVFVVTIENPLKKYWAESASPSSAMGNFKQAHGFAEDTYEITVFIDRDSKKIVSSTMEANNVTYCMTAKEAEAFVLPENISEPMETSTELMEMSSMAFRITGVTGGEEE